MHPAASSCSLSGRPKLLARSEPRVLRSGHPRPRSVPCRPPALRRRGHPAFRLLRNGRTPPHLNRRGRTPSFREIRFAVHGEDSWREVHFQGRRRDPPPGPRSNSTARCARAQAHAELQRGCAPRPWIRRAKRACAPHHSAPLLPRPQTPQPNRAKSRRQRSLPSRRRASGRADSPPRCESSSPEESIRDLRKAQTEALIYLIFPSSSVPTLVEQKELVIESEA